MSDFNELEDMLCDLISRMDTAEVRLVDMSLEHKPGSTQAIRLDSKANGVRLASGYVSEELRRGSPASAIGDEPVTESMELRVATARVAALEAQLLAAQAAQYTAQAQASHR